MNVRIFALLLLVVLSLSVLAGCSSTASGLDALEDKVERQFDTVEDRIEAAIAPDAAQSPAPTETPAPAETNTAAPVAALTEDEAKAIALEHAGFSAEEVTHLHTEYEIDDGIPEYKVQFHRDRWEYEYEIHAETGVILSYEKDD